MQNCIKELTSEEIALISGGFRFRLDIGQTLAAIALGAVTGGPVGIGYALSVMVMAEGINGLNNMHKEKQYSFGQAQPPDYPWW